MMKSADLLFVNTDHMLLFISVVLTPMFNPHCHDLILIFDFWCFNATFNNISAISWRPVSVVEEAGVPGENHRPWASNW
jgi:hypothetical protein